MSTRYIAAAAAALLIAFWIVGAEKGYLISDRHEYVPNPDDPPIDAFSQRKKGILRRSSQFWQIHWNLPIWRNLPYAAYWLVPSAVGIPLIVWALARELKIAIGAEGTVH